jgi:hypothetical protein
MSWPSFTSEGTTNETVDEADVVLRLHVVVRGRRGRGWPASHSGRDYRCERPGGRPIVPSRQRIGQEGWARVKPFVAAKGIKYSILLDDGSVEKAFKVTALPATYLIDRAGRLAATYIGVVDPVDLEANIKTIVAEQ